MGVAGSEWVLDRVGEITYQIREKFTLDFLKAECQNLIFEMEKMLKKKGGGGGGGGGHRKVLRGDRPDCGKFVPKSKK